MFRNDVRVIVCFKMKRSIAAYVSVSDPHSQQHRHSLLLAGFSMEGGLFGTCLVRQVCVF